MKHYSLKLALAAAVPGSECDGKVSHASEEWLCAFSWRAPAHRCTHCDQRSDEVDFLCV